MSEPHSDPSTRIAALNDAFRRTTTQHVYFTATLTHEGPEALVALLQQVRGFVAFTPENDPYGEHDFGSFTFRFVCDGRAREETIFWKIDTYADASLSHGADDPLSPGAVRVLTIMHASDY